MASTAAALEKAVLMAGNIQGIHSVTSDASINNGETLGSDETFYVILKGDTLWKIKQSIETGKFNRKPAKIAQFINNF